MTVKDLSDLVIYAGAVAGALGAIGALAYWALVRPFVRWLREELGATRAAAVASSTVVDQVHAEVTPNHGSSMKDAVNRIEGEVRRLRHDEVAQLRQELTEHLTDTTRHPGGA